MNQSAQNKSCGKRVFLRAAAAGLTLAAALFLIGCINPGGLSDGSGTETPNRFAAKWETTDPKARFVSIELTDAQVYIVVEREESSRSERCANTVKGSSISGKTAPALLKAKEAQLTSETPKIYIGKYTVSEDSIIYLIDFGVLQIDLSQSGESAVIRLQLEPDIPSIGIGRYEFNAERAAEVDSSKNTDLLCRHWSYVRFLLNGELWEPWENPELWEDSWSFPQSKPQVTNLFSKAGTYLQTVIVDGVETISFLGQWRWADENENAFYHTDWQNGGWQTDMVHVTLTETTFVTTEILNHGYILTTEYELF